MDLFFSVRLCMFRMDIEERHVIVLISDINDLKPEPIE